MINYTAKVQLFLHSYNRLFMAFHIPNIWHRHKKRGCVKIGTSSFCFLSSAIKKPCIICDGCFLFSSIIIVR